MFTKDSRTENFLTQMGVSFTYSNSVKYSSLMPEWDCRNLARPIPRREDAIIEYATLMENGSAAPAPILHNTGKWLDVIDGVQRIAAAELAGYSQLSAYIVECDSENLVTSLKVLSNARLQGRAEPAEWTRRRAVEVLVVQQQMTPSEVAKMGGWKISDIERIANSISWSKAIQSIGGPSEVSDSMVDVLSQYTTQDKIKKYAAPVSALLNTIKSSAMSASDSSPYIEEFFKPIEKESSAYRVYMERVESLRKEPEIIARVHGRKHGRIPHDVNLRRSIRTAITILDQIITSGESIIYVDEFFKLVNTLDSKLHQIAKSHKKPIKSDTPADKWIKSHE